MDKDRPYWNMELEPLFNTPEIREVQLHNLKRYLERIYEKSKVHRDFCDKHGGRPDNIKSLEEFSGRYPALNKDETQAHLLSYMGGQGFMDVIENLFTCDRRDVVLIATTSGTTGTPTPYLFTKNELKIFSETYSRVLWRCGLRPGDAAVHALALSMFGGGIPLAWILIDFGMTVLPVGAESGSERVLSYTNGYSQIVGGIDCIWVTPSFAEYLIEQAPGLIDKEVKDLGIKNIISGGEPGAGIPEVRSRIESAYGARLYDCMGLTSIMFVSCDHDEYQGMHFVSEDISLLELVHPETREPIPLENGATGVAVMTPLEGESLTGIRHFSGDVMQVFTDPCPCGKSGMRIKVIGRTDDMLKVKGVMVYPAAIDEVITGFSPRVTGEFRIVLHGPPPRVEPPLHLRVEYSPDVPQESLDALAREIEEKMHSKIRVRPRIEWIPSNTLERSTHKTKYIEKAYE